MGKSISWDPIDGLLMYTIDGRSDIASGRLTADCRSAANSSSGNCFTSLCYSADGSYILSGGSIKYSCMYDIADQSTGYTSIVIIALCTLLSSFLASVRYSGLMIHFVDVAQRVVLVLANDIANELAARVLQQGHQLYFEVAEAVCEERIVWKEDWCPAHTKQSKPQ